MRIQTYHVQNPHTFIVESDRVLMIGRFAFKVNCLANLPWWHPLKWFYFDKSDEGVFVRIAWLYVGWRFGDVPCRCAMCERTEAARPLSE